MFKMLHMTINIMLSNTICNTIKSKQINLNQLFFFVNLDKGESSISRWQKLEMMFCQFINTICGLIGKLFELLPIISQFFM